MIVFFSRQRVFAMLFSIFVVITGVLFFVLSPKESLPEIKLGFIIIKTIYPNSSPEEVEKLVTNPIEDSVKNIKGIKEINSTSSEGASIIILSLNENIKNTESIINNIKSSISKINDLPQEIIGPDVVEITTDEFPILQLSISGVDDYLQLKKTVDLLNDKILKIKGVARVEKIGYWDKVIYVNIDKEKLNNYSLTVFSVINSIKSRNFSIPVGFKEFDGKEFSIRTISEIKQPEQIKEIIVRANETGNVTQIKDVADIKIGFQEENLKIKANGENAIILTIYKTRAEDTMRINKEIFKLSNEIKTILPQDIKINFFNDSSKFIKDRIDLVNSNGLLGGIFVFFILMIFIKPIIAFLVAASIPIVFGLSLILIKALGLTYDMLSLFGFVMAIGLIVDNAIVLGENIYRYLTKEKNMETAIQKGALEVFKSVLASTLTTIASFFPLLLVGGILGSFLRPIPTVVIITISVSFVVAYFILPALIRNYVKEQENKFTLMQEKLIKKLKDYYEKLLMIVLKRKKIFLFITFILLIFSFYLGSIRGFSFFTTQIDEIVIKITTKPDFSLKETENIINKIEEICLNINKDDLDTVYTYIGRQDGNSGIPEISTNLGQINIVLKLESQRKTKDINEIISFLQEKIGNPEGVEQITIGGVRREGGGTRSDVSIDIIGDDIEKIKKVSEEIISVIKNEKGIKKVFSDYVEGKNEYRIIIDEKKCAISAVSPSQIGIVLRSYVSGIEATNIDIEGEKIKIILKAEDTQIKNINKLIELSVPNNFGRNIPIKNLVKIEENKTNKTIKHKDTKNTIGVFATIDRKHTNVAKINQGIFKRIQKIKEQNPELIIQASGEFKEMMENFKQIGLAFLLALFIIYMILAVLFNSFIQPFIMMITVPFGFIGVMFSLFIHGLPISFAAFMGFVALTGVVVNNAIILNDFVNKFKNKTKDKEKAIIDACKTRLRPIILTTLTTIVGLIPIGYGILGSRDAFLQPVAIVFGWGLLFSSFITLFIVPVIIYYLNKN